MYIKEEKRNRHKVASFQVKVAKAPCWPEGSCLETDESEGAG